MHRYTQTARPGVARPAGHTLRIARFACAIALLSGSILAATPRATAASLDRGSTPSPTPIAASSVLPAAGLQADVAILRRTYETLHPGLYRYASKAEMDARFDALARDVGSDRTLADAYLRISRFTASIRCGHTYANFFNQSRAIRTALFERPDKLPFFFRLRDGAMVVTRDLTPDGALPPGTIVRSVNGITASELLSTTLPYVRGDGANDAKRIDLLAVRGEARYDAADVFWPLLFATRWTTPFHLEITRPDGTAASIVAQAQTFAQRVASVEVMQPPANGDAPLFSTQTMPDGTVVITMPTWSVYDSKWNWHAWLDAALDAAKNAPTLVLDLRGNEGGSDDVGATILAHLPDRPNPQPTPLRLVRAPRVPEDLRPYATTYDPSLLDWGSRAVPLAGALPITAPAVPYLQLLPRSSDATAVAEPRHEPYRGRVRVAIDAANSSATFAFAQTIKQRGLGTLVGTPTGGNRRGTNGDAFLFVTLPNSGIEVDLPLVGTFPLTDEPDTGLEPDVLAP